MFAQIGLGLLSNMLQGGANRPNAAQTQEAMAHLRNTMSESSQLALRQAEDPFGEGSQYPLQNLEGEAPPFPDKAADRLSQRQQANAQERSTFWSETKHNLDDLKTGFFEDHHLRTEPEPDGKEKVALDQQGKPQVQQGKETPQQRVARESFETQRKNETQGRHETERETFVQDEKQIVATFLQNHKPDLGNPAVQSELQKMIMLSHKKALGLTRKQEEESLKLDIYDENSMAVADKKLGDLREMEDRHAKDEDNSPEAGELFQHQQDLGELLRQKREDAKQVALEEQVLKGPPRFDQASQGREGDTDVASVLPPYLSNALYEMEIYTV
jgi:hypothetical protein